MRHKKAEKRTVVLDKIYKNRLVEKFINNIMQDGKKTTAQRVVYTAFEILATKKADEEPVALFEKAILTVGPKVEVRAKRVGGANYQVPSEVRGERKVSLAMRWIITAAKARPNKEFHSLAEKLAAEILAAAENQGEAIKKRDTVLRMAEANRAFSHFRW